MSAFGTKQTSRCRVPMSAFGVKADIVRRPDHTFKISARICEADCVRARPTNFGGRPRLRTARFKSDPRTNFVNNIRSDFLFLHFPFNDLTQNQQCYWPNSDPKSQPLRMSLLQSRP